MAIEEGYEVFGEEEVGGVATPTDYHLLPSAVACVSSGVCVRAGANQLPSVAIDSIERSTTEVTIPLTVVDAESDRVHLDAEVPLPLKALEALALKAALGVLAARVGAAIRGARGALVEREHDVGRVDVQRQAAPLVVTLSPVGVVLGPHAEVYPLAC